MSGRPSINGGCRRGQSSPIALVLIFGLVIGATTVVLLVGGLAITDTQDQLNTQSAEKAMTQLDSQASLVALGQSRSQTVSLGSTGSNSYKVSNSAGTMTVTYTNSTNGSERQLMSADMGAIVYENDDGSQVAYQGGGVWRSGGNGGATMVSPPEFHYEGGTLTLPLVTVSNNATIDGDAVIKEDSRSPAYPNKTLSNPLKGGTVTITVESQYHDGWYRYLNTRTQGTVDHYPGNQTVEMTLTVPVEQNFDSTMATISNDIDNEDAIEDPIETGIDAPLADGRIDAKIAECKQGGCTTPLPTSDGTMIGPGTYYADSDTTLGDVTFDTDGEDINVVVNGTIGTDSGNTDIDIEDGGNVTWYIKGDVDLSGNPNINTNGDPDDLLVMVHSKGDSIGGGTIQLTGLVYAPGSKFEIDGGGCNTPNSGPDDKCPNVVGSIVAGSADGGDAGDIDYGGNITRRLEFTTTSAITYLHVSENRITVED